jgi:SAM-dependent methyltransferase
MDSSLQSEFAEIEWTHWWFVGRREILRDTLRRWLVAGPGPHHHRILDVGCGAGAMLGVLSEFGTVSGMDTSEDAIRYSRELFPTLSLEVGAIPEALPPPGSVDVITAFDVIEHIDNDVGALKELAVCVAPGGLVFLTVPAYMWLWGPHDDLNHHRRRYTRRRLLAAIASSGLKVESTTYFNSLLLPVVAAVRIGHRMLGKDQTPRSDFAMPGPAANRMLTRLLSSERLILRRARIPFGVSLLAVLRRPG